MKLQLLLITIISFVTCHFEWTDKINDRHSYYGPYIKFAEDKCNFYKDGLAIDLKRNINSESNHVIDKSLNLYDFDAQKTYCVGLYPSDLSKEDQCKEEMNEY